MIDVSDFSNPTEDDSIIFEKETASEVTKDHHAFMYDPEYNLIALPVGPRDDFGQTNITHAQGNIYQIQVLCHV